MLQVPLLALVAYLVGAIPFGYLVARARGVDILRHGSGNIGATNVGRVLGRRWGVLIFLLDAAKGALPVLLTGALLEAPAELPPQTLPVVAGVSAFLGHLFPIYLRFRGGKGVATGAGVMAVLLPGPTLAALLTWVTALACTRYVSAASLSAAAVLCVLRLAFTAEPWALAQRVVTLFCVTGALLVTVRHAGNIRRLLGGTENRLDDTPTMLLLAKTIHVLALGLWFGTVVFFTITDVILFRTFDDAGAVVGALFPWCFGIQAACALLASGTALSWALRRRERAHRARAAVLVAALVAVGAGWALGQGHGYRLLVNILTLALVTVAMALAAQLPCPAPLASTVAMEKERLSPASAVGEDRP
jgi:acyl-phosphate glycerol 3-phosphate acyltransferase